MVVQINHYVVLGLPSGGGLSDEEIKKAYRSKLLLVHHDRDDFLKLLHSYQVLKDPKSRKLFDDRLRIQREREEKVRRRRRMMSRSAASSFVKEEDIIDVESISKITKEDNATKRQRLMMSRSANSSFVKEEDIIDVESISKITQLPSKQEDDDSKISRSAANAFVKEKYIIDVESISKVTPKQEDDDSKMSRSAANAFVGEDIIDVKSISKISGKQEDDWTKGMNRKANYIPRPNESEDALDRYLKNTAALISAEMHGIHLRRGGEFGVTFDLKMIKIGILKWYAQSRCSKQMTISDFVKELEKKLQIPK